MESILAFLNDKIREEHGKTVFIDSLWTDADIDSYGSIMVILELHDKYGCFDKDWSSQVDWSKLTIQEIVDRIKNESTVV